MSTDLPEPDPRRWWTLVVLCSSLSVISLDNTVLNVALPTLADELKASNADLQWIVDSYVLVFAGCLLTAGSLGDRYGRKSALNAGMIIFGISSTLAAFLPDVEALIAARSVMGVGAALMMPATLSILTNVFTDPVERGRAVGIWAGIAGAAIGMGPIVGGALLAHFWWGAVFLVNGPLVIVMLIAGHYFIPNSKDPTASRIDIPGAVLSMAGVSLLVFVIIEAPLKGLGDSLIVVALTASVLMLVAFAWWELTTPTPMLDLSLFRNPRFSVASLAITLAAFTITGTLFGMTQFLQFVLGHSPLSAGVHMLPIAITMMTLSPVMARLNERYGSKRVVAGALTASAVGLLILATSSPDTPYVVLAAGLSVTWAGIIGTLVPATDAIMGSVPRDKAGVGSAVNDTTRQLGGALGIAVLGSLLASFYRDQLTSRTGSLAVPQNLLEQARISLSDAIASGNRALATAGREAYDAAMNATLLINAAMLVVGGVLAYAYLPARDRVIEPVVVPNGPPTDDSADDVMLGVTQE